jgi:hypothetical protein
VRHGVFVLGMHRSGTSAATRLVNLVGVPTCSDGELVAPTDDNPRGYWESVSLTAFNDRLLAALGCDWSCPPPLEVGWEVDPALAELRAEAAKLFPEAIPTEQWVWKDPRNCVTFDFWAAALDVRPVIVLVDRNPLEVAASLAVRDDLGKVYALALWERYLRRCLASISGLPTLVTGYEELLSDPLGWCERVRRFLETAGVSTAPVDVESARGYVDPDLRHARHTSAELLRDPAVSEPQQLLVEALQSLQGPHESLAAPDLPPESVSTDALLAERRRLYPREREFSELGGYARDLGERYVALEAYVRDLEGRHADVETYARELAERHADVETYARELAERYAELERYARELTERAASS